MNARYLFEIFLNGKRIGYIEYDQVVDEFQILDVLIIMLIAAKAMHLKPLGIWKQKPALKVFKKFILEYG